MKLQYLGDSKDSFKWDYHDFLVSELQYPLLAIAWMLTPDDNSNHGKSKPNLFPARNEIINFCVELRQTRSLNSIRNLPIITGNSYGVSIHKGNTYFTMKDRDNYFSDFHPNFNQVVFLDPDNGFEPEKSLNKKHARYSEITTILNQVPKDSVVSVFHHFRRISFVDDYARIKERIEDGYSTAIYWNQLMFVAISKSKDAIERVVEANKKYSIGHPVKIL